MFWASGFWVEGFWVDGFWEGTYEVPVVAAGGGGKRRRVSVSAPVNDELRRIPVSLWATDVDDALVAFAAHLAWVQLAMADQDDALRALVSIAWPEAKLVIDAIRLKRTPPLRLIRSAALVRA